MIEYASGDILKSKAEALVNTVNCVGIMGRGIALDEHRIILLRAALDRRHRSPGATGNAVCFALAGDQETPTVAAV